MWGINLKWNGYEWGAITLIFALITMAGCNNYEAEAPTPLQLENIEIARGIPQVISPAQEAFLDSTLILTNRQQDSLFKWTNQSLRHITDIRERLDSLIVWAHLHNGYHQKQALFYADYANKIATENNIKVYEAISKYYRSEISAKVQFLGKGLEVALADIKISVRLLQSLNRSDWTALTTTQLGYIQYLLSPSDTTAKVNFEKALLIADSQTISEPEGQFLKSKTYHSLGNYYLRSAESEYGKAHQYFELAEGIYTRMNNKPALSSLWQSLAIKYYYEAYFLSYRNGPKEEVLVKFKNAEQLLTQCLDYLESLGKDKLYWRIWMDFGELKLFEYFALKEKKYFDSGIAYLNKAEQPNFEHLTRVYDLKGQFFHSYSNKINRNDKTAIVMALDSALFYYKKASINAQKTGAFYELPALIKNLTNVCNDRNKYVPKEDKPIDCSDILQNPVAQFASIQYQGALEPIKSSLDSANQILNTEERREQQGVYATKLSRMRSFSGGALIIAGFFFMIIYQRQQRKKLEAKMEALRAQINPHFISNSLNAIESLVNLDQKEAAAKYIIHFSRLSRRILNRSRGPITHLKDEFDTLKHFLALEQLRFRNKLSYTIDIAKDLQAEFILIPSLLLQPYVENAIWHGIKPKQGPGHLSISAHLENHQLVCIIEDDGIGREKAGQLKAASVIKQKSMGMQITKERIRGFGGRKKTSVDIIDLKDENGKANGTKVIIKLPLKTKKVAS